jgi:hypothetical protein
MSKSVELGGTMKLRMSRVLRFWINVEYEDIENQGPDRPRTEVIAQTLRAYEEAGDAMRFLNGDGRISWKATPRMLSRLADAREMPRIGKAALGGRIPYSEPCE